MTKMAKDAMPLRRLLIHGGYWRWSISMQLVRLPTLMASLAFLLVGIYVTGSQTIGGWMVTVFIVTQVCLALFVGHFLDKAGATKATFMLLWVAALALIGLAIASILKAPAFALLLLAGVAGIFTASSPSAVRSMLRQCVPASLVPSALAMDATILELAVVSAPLIAAAAGGIFPPGAVLAMAGTVIVAALLVRNLDKPAVADTTQTNTVNETAGAAPSTMMTETAPSAPLWRNLRFTFWILLSIAFGHVLGTAEVGALPLALRLGGKAGEAAGLIAVLSASSALGGIAYAAFSHKLPLKPITQTCIMLILLIAGCFGLSLATNWATVIVTMIVIGSCTAPLGVVRGVSAENEVPTTRKTEAFSALNAAHGLGYALGGFFLAILPLKEMLSVGSVGVILTLVLALVMFRSLTITSASASSNMEG